MNLHKFEIPKFKIKDIIFPAIFSLILVLTANEALFAQSDAYIVQPGDTLNQILRTNGIEPTPDNIEYITGINGITNPDIIYVGQEIVLEDRYAKFEGTYISSIVVDISEQKLCTYDALGNLMVCSFVITGKDKTLTDLGTTRIYAKIKNLYMSGSDPDGSNAYENLLATKFMLFNNDGEGIHPAPWRIPQEYGDPSRRSLYGTHGCVNTPARMVDFIWNNSDYNTLVTIED